MTESPGSYDAVLGGHSPHDRPTSTNITIRVRASRADIQNRALESDLNRLMKKHGYRLKKTGDYPSSRYPEDAYTHLNYERNP